MSVVPTTDVTRLIRRIHDGDAEARQDLWTLVYEELRRLAAGQMSRERNLHTLQPTALVHEAWLRLSGGHTANPWENRAHFFAVAAEAMRRILVEHARRRQTVRRGRDRNRLSLTDQALENLERSDFPGGDDLPEDIEALDRALERLERTGRHDRKCRVVALRFFAGLTIEQAAHAIGTSPASVKRDWDFAKAWLSRELQREQDET